MSGKISIGAWLIALQIVENENARDLEETKNKPRTKRIIKMIRQRSDESKMQILEALEQLRMRVQAQCFTQRMRDICVNRFVKYALRYLIHPNIETFRPYMYCCTRESWPRAMNFLRHCVY